MSTKKSKTPSFGINDLVVEWNSASVADNSNIVFGNAVVMITPPIDEDYWMVRVRVSRRQAVVAFPKFTTYGIGFQVERDWNTNLPYSVAEGAPYIWNHIKHNKGRNIATEETCLKAIQMLIDAIKQFKGEK